jgi:glyoxylase-like metal-dependent hydrolase (beta-lactamase superfamily II)/8-oxo-dGTP pyrophosphatase MutT (NUDIX family)
VSRPPKKSAVVIPLTRGGDGELLALVGRRNPRSRFLGGFFAFPGGVAEPEDGDLARDDELEVLRRTASRELWEETGLRVAPDALRPAGWRVTPPFTPRRFDTKMFVAALDEAVEPAPPDPGELIDLHWARPRELMERWRTLEIRIAPPLLPMLRQLADGGDGSVDELVARLAEVNVERDDTGPRIEFVPDVHMVTLRTPTLPPATHTNCYLVGAEEFLIVDPGSGEEREIARLLRQVALRREAGATPHAVVLTHHHGDHVAGAAPVARELAVPVWAHAATWERWPEGRAVRAERGRDLADGDGTALSGGEKLRVMHTPGHAAGHVALLEERRGSLFAGDLLSGVSTVLVDSAPGSLDLYLESLARLRDCGARTLFPAHGPPLIDPPKVIRRLLDHRAEREERILAAIAGGAYDLAAIVREAYADTPGADPGLAARQVESHLDRLERLGRVRAKGGRWQVAAG